MTDKEKKAWEALVNASTVGYGNDELRSWKDVDTAILAADAELRRLREAVEWACDVIDGPESRLRGYWGDDVDLSWFSPELRARAYDGPTVSPAEREPR